MRNYTIINSGQSWDTIGQNVESQLRAYPETNEIMYARIPKTKRMYASYVLNASFRSDTTMATSPAVRNAEFIHAVPASELVETLKAESFPHKLPRRVRVIRADRKRDVWGVFFEK